MDYTTTIELLRRLIETPSHSRNEEGTAEILFAEMIRRGYTPQRIKNNVLVYNQYFSPEKPTVVLSAHHDTVRPNENYTRDPYLPTEIGGKIYGLGSNDDGASLVSLVALFDHFYSSSNLKYNLCLALSAEEECSGANGMELLYPQIINPELVVVGEPTGMDIAIAERGLMVLDCEVEGVAGHAAHSNTVNPIMEALTDLNWFNTYHFDKVSKTLGEVKMSVTIISAGSTHNVVPAKCNFTVDVRSNGCYSNLEILEIIKANVACSVKERSTRLNPSAIDTNHPFVKCCIEAGAKPFGSSTLSDQALVKCDSVKIGVGDSARSHTSDEYVLRSEIEEGIAKYIEIFKNYLI